MQTEKPLAAVSGKADPKTIWSQKRDSFLNPLETHHQLRVLNPKCFLIFINRTCFLKIAYT